MPISEFEMIKKYFRDLGPKRPDTILGIGDDAAIISPPDNCELLTAIRQWQPGQDYKSTELGEKVACSMLESAMADLQIKKATPAWMTLSLTFKELDEHWITSFSQGLAKIANINNIELIGGDTSRGPETLRLHLTGHKEI